jgi:glycosyltransferase involved in cell wall biosynthesis
MWNRRRVLYFNHDLARPSGGVRMIYSHVGHLVRNGFDAYVVHAGSGFRPAWFSEDVPTLYTDDEIDIRSDDLLIFPEDAAGMMESAMQFPVQKAIFCQNHFGLFSGLGAHRTWRELGIGDVIAASDAIAKFIRESLGDKETGVHIVHDAVDPNLFCRKNEKKLQVALMPRKRRQEAQFIRDMVTRLLPAETQLGWVELDGLPQKRVADAMCESAIFLALSWLEGFGLPPLEAMSCGSIVVGFNGFGGAEYSRPDNGFWSPEGDIVHCAQSLKRVVDLILAGDAQIENVRALGFATAAEYSPSRQESELLQAIKMLLMQSAPQR